jgi:tetratricopeptide (TPR) repeat protein
MAFDEAPDVFAIQDRISRGVVHELGLMYRESRRRPGTNLDAYERYFRAIALVERRGFINGKQAGELFREAIALAPTFAVAHAGLAMAYVFRSFPFRGISFDEAYPTMHAAARKAVELEPELAEAHVAMGWVHAYGHDWLNADRAFRSALALNASLPLVYTSYSLAVLQPLQRYEKALDLLRTAARHDPQSLDVQREIGEVHLSSGRYTAAADVLGRVSALEPEFPFVPHLRAKALMLSGRVGESFPLLEPGHPYLASAFVRSGRRREAERLVAAWEPYAYARTVVVAALGDSEQAIAGVQRVAVVEPHRLGRLLNEAELASVRDDPRVRALRERFRLP